MCVLNVRYIYAPWFAARWPEPAPPEQRPQRLSEDLHLTGTALRAEEQALKSNPILHLVVPKVYCSQVIAQLQESNTFKRFNKQLNENEIKTKNMKHKSHQKD